MHNLMLRQQPILQGFQQFSKVEDIVLKAPDETAFGTRRRLMSAEGAS